MYINPSPSIDEIIWLRDRPRSYNERGDTAASYALAIELRQVGQLTLQQIADYLGVSQQCARYRIVRGERIIQQRREELVRVREEIAHA